MSSVQLVDAIRIDLTDTCNARCRFCPFHGELGTVTTLLRDRKGEISFLTLQDFERIAVELIKEQQFPQCKFSGRGEATTHPEFEKIVRLLTQSGMSVRLITNGLRLLRFVDLLYECDTTTLVSLHGPEEAHDQAVGINGAYKKVSQAILLLKKKGGKVSIATVMTPEAIPHLPTFIKKWEEHGVDVRLQHDYQAWRKANFPLTELKRALSQICNMKNITVLPDLRGTTLDNYYKIDVNLVINSKVCRRVEREIDLRSDGTVYSCRSKPFGNIRDSNIIDLMLSHHRENFLKQIRKETQRTRGLDSSLCDRCCHQVPPRR